MVRLLKYLKPYTMQVIWVLLLTLMGVLYTQLLYWSIAYMTLPNEESMMLANDFSVNTISVMILAILCKDCYSFLIHYP